MNKYVLGIILIGKNKTLLQRKNRGGSLLNGKLNAIGGKIEEAENSLCAMRREYFEETGDSNNLKWKRVGSLEGSGYSIDVFVTKMVDYYYDAFDFKSNDPNMEELFILNISDISWEDTAPNLKEIYINIGVLSV